MLGLQEQVLADYVETGQVKLIFWPVLNHGNASVYATVTMECAGLQSAEIGWAVHHSLFVNQSNLWRAERDYLIQLAVAEGADQATFEACYDNQDTIIHLQNLDQIRVERGVNGQPFFEVNGQLFAGDSTLISAIEAALP